MTHCKSQLLSLHCGCTNSLEDECEQKSHRNCCYQQEGENDGDDDEGERNNQRKLQEHVKVEGKHSVHFLLIFGEAVEDAARRRGIEETHGAAYNLRWFARAFVANYDLSSNVELSAARILKIPS